MLMRSPVFTIQKKIITASFPLRLASICERTEKSILHALEGFGFAMVSIEIKPSAGSHSMAFLVNKTYTNVNNFPGGGLDISAH